MRYFIRMNYLTGKPVSLYRFDAESLSEQLWSGAKWVETPNTIVESLFKSGDLEEIKRDEAEDFFPQAFSRA